MSDTTLMALFEDIDPAAEGIEKLHEMGLSDDRISVISGIPVPERALGRPRQHTFVPRLAMGGAVAGFLFGLFLNFGSPQLYYHHVGGQPVIPIPPGIIILFEMTMLFMLLSTFVGLFINSNFPSYAPHYYAPEISDGKIGVFFACPSENETTFVDALNALGAETVRRVEAQQL
jgi:hypothetical protein